MRHELLECFVRIAVAKYINGSKELDDVSEAVDRLLCVIFDDEPGLPPEAKHDPDGFRTERLFLEQVDDVVKTHYRPLRLLYDKYSMLNPLQGKARFGIEEWASFVGDVRLVSEDLTMRELRLAFWWSRMVVVDEARPPPRAPEHISRARAFRSSSDSAARAPMIVSPIPPLFRSRAGSSSRRSRGRSSSRRSRASPT